MAREWGVWGSPPFEEVTSTHGAGVGGLGVPPIRRGDTHPWRVSVQLMVYATLGIIILIYRKLTMS